MKNAFKYITCITVLACFFSIHPVKAQTGAQDFRSWLSSFEERARERGVGKAVTRTAFATLDKPNARVLELDRKQPEGRLSFDQYYRKVVSATRINKGRAMLRKHYPLLKRVEARYGVAPQYIVALWGIETSYGAFTGGFDVIEALATLAYDGRRGAFFEGELLDALEILQEGHIARTRMRGSWAGAMGQSQFMPSSFRNFAVDFNRDGRKDIWTSLPDVFGSAANYLAENGWREGQRWGREVRLPEGFDETLLGLDTRKTLQAWSDKGVRLVSGGPVPVEPGFTPSIIRFKDGNKRAFMVYNNYRTIMSWNRSTYFATSVGLLADMIAR